MQDSYIVHWQAELSGEQGGNQFILHGHTHDISLGGANLHLEQALDFRGPLTLELKIPKGKSIQDWATVRVVCRVVLVTEAEDHFRVQVHFDSFIGDGKQVLEGACNERRGFSAS
ncbi:MAG TPA: PilZ domain-containing protein [Sideroxyarcus sp.]|nr:PilZ domain-containing protein [Sideroxyarcus sp.]